VPGFFGIIETSPAGSTRQQHELIAMLGGMSKAMRYDPAYSAELASCPNAGAYAGHVGLFADEESHVARSASGVLAVTAGNALLSACDALKVYECAGAQGIVDVPGCGAVFVADPTCGQCLVITDRFGRERVFLHTTGSRVLFASEAKAILAVAPETRAFDPTGIAEWLACGCTVGSQSVFRRIDVLEGGTLLSIAGSRMRRSRYFDLAQLEQTSHVSGSAFVEGFSASLRSAVNASRRRVPTVGVSLTGGLDSRMIMSSLDAGPAEVPCYTFGSMYRTTGDVSLAGQVAAACGQPHHVIELGNEFLENAAEYLEKAVYASDGYLGLSGAAEFYCNRQARTIAPRRMTGNWGGELMRGVRAFKYALPKGGFINHDIVNQVRMSADRFSPPSSSPLSAALFQQLPHQGYGRYAVERSQVRVETPFLDPEVVRWLYQAPAGIRESGATAAAIISRRPELLDIPTDAGLLGVQPSWWRHVLRRSVVKAEYLTSHGAPDWCARLSSALPARMLETRFLGVDKFHHFRFWTRRHLAGLVRDTLSGQDRHELATWFDMRRVNQMVEEHIEGRANHTDAIDKLLTVAVARETLLASRTLPSDVEFHQRELAL
jgi:asparagine synthase (glutamine-hydrolysing)